MKTLETQRDVLKALLDQKAKLSIQQGKSRIINRTSGEVIARVKNGLAGKLVDKKLMKYDGAYEITEAGEREAQKGTTRKIGRISTLGHLDH